MKLLTKEEEQAHYYATLRGGIGGGLLGITLGVGAVYAASVRFPAFRSLTLPLRAFLVTSSGTFAAIISADKYSRAFEKSRHAEEIYKDASVEAVEEARARQSFTQRALTYGRENRYPIVTASWIASMGTAFALVSRNKYLTGAQKLVQARVYAQGLTLAVLLASAAFEVGDANTGKGRWETVQILDPNDPSHKRLIDKRIHHENYSGEDQWRDMIETEERRLKARGEQVAKAESDSHKKSKTHDSTSPAKSSSPSPNSASTSTSAPSPPSPPPPNPTTTRALPEKPTSHPSPKLLGKEAATQGQDGSTAGESSGPKQSGRKVESHDAKA